MNSQAPKNGLFLEEGLSAATILAQLQDLKAKDLPWQTGRVFAYVFEPDSEARHTIEAAYQLYLGENGLDPTAFPSLLKLETEVVRMVAELLHGDQDVVGNFTSGGTESIILAVKTARDYFRAHRPEIEKPEIILPQTAHAAFQKAAHYLGVKAVIVPVQGPDYGVSVETVRQALTPNTILIMGSAPNYPHGVMDPIVDLAALAQSKGIFMHVDACVGGMYLPFARELGYAIPPFDFEVPGVTSISCDLHKYGYAAKGASCVLYRNEDIRRYQIFSCSNWAGYTIVNPTVLSSKTGGPLAGAWTALRCIGKKGYRQMCQATQEATQAFIEGIAQMPSLQVLGQPVMNLVAVISKDPRISVFDISDRMKEWGWYLQVQLASSTSPEALHLNINRANCPHIPALLQDLQRCLQSLSEQQDQPQGLALDPAMIEYFMANFSPELLSQFKEMLGMGGEGTPDKMSAINGILNQLQPAQRDMLLLEFVNQMFK